MNRYHFIAIGGAVMHQLAICLQSMGNEVSGSDDIIFDPAKSNLREKGLLPFEEGWFPERIHEGLDAVILGMHAKPDNPELRRALDLGIPVYSFPEFVFHNAREKKRIVIAGSHGKTTITAMVMHMLRQSGLEFDYLVGSKLDDFDTMVQLSRSANIMVIEGDEYLSSPVDRRSKFLHYRPHIAVITGIAWDHINVFPDYASYLDTFRKFVASMENGGSLIWYRPDVDLSSIVDASVQPGVETIAYEEPAIRIDNEKTEVLIQGNWVEPFVFGRHNYANLVAASEVGRLMNLPKEDIAKSLATFRGTARRLECLLDMPGEGIVVYRDFAHAPSKVKATVSAVRERYPDKALTVIFELHTYSSLQDDFLDFYADSLRAADHAIVYLDDENLRIKGKVPFTEDRLKEAFGRKDIRVARNKAVLESTLKGLRSSNAAYLFMSSGHFGSLNLTDWI